jgi:Na+/H+ antiporter NhaC
VLPIVVVAIVTVVTEDILMGLFIALALCFVMYLPQRLMNFTQYFDYVIKGLVDMFPVLILIIMAYTLMEVNGGLGLTPFVIDTALKALNPALLPVTVFIVIALLSFASGSFWGLAAISFPIVGPLAIALGVNPFLCAGAVVSAVAFGGHICIYSDTVILTSASTQVTNVDYFRTSLPLVLVPFVLSAIGFLILGFIM